MAQVDIEQWIEIIIVLLIVGGSIFGAVAKKLIKAFSPKEPDESGGKNGMPVRPSQHPAALPQRQFESKRPTARSVQPASPPVARRRPSPPMVIQSMPEEPAPPDAARARGVRQRPPTARPVASPPPKPGRQTPRVREPAPALAEKRLGHVEMAVLEEEARFEAGAERRMRHLESAVPQEEKQFDEAVEERFGHMEPAPYEEPAGAKARLALIRRSSRQTLRRAVVLREILSPPLGLRPRDEGF